MRWAPLLLVVVLVVAACDGDVADPTTTATTGRASTSAAPTTTATSTPTLAPATTTADAPTTTTTDLIEFTIGVSGGAVEGPDRIEVSRGDFVAIVVTADTADEVHLHGYDVFADVTPDQAARIEFVADIPGVFELELEGARLTLSELEVS
jgi:hypothetical protein